jgi:hypothetical protein
MAMKLKRTNRQAQQMRRRTLLIAAAGSILGLIIALVVIFNFSYIKNIFAAGNTYYSRANGNWESAATWSTTGYEGAAASDYPKAGDIVYIGGKTVTVTGTMAAAQEVRLTDGDVATQLTIGTGKKLVVAGNYYMTMSTSAKSSLTTLVTGAASELNVGGDIIMTQENGKEQLLLTASGGGKIVAAGNLTVTDKNGKENTKISIQDASQLLVGKNLSLTSEGGGGQVYVSLTQSAKMNVSGNMMLDAKSLESVAISATDNSAITLSGSIVQTGQTNGSITTTGSSQFILAGNGAQTMDGSDTGTDSLVISELRVDNLGTGAQIQLGTNVYVTNKLTMVQGTLVSKNGAMLTLGPNATTSGGSASSFVSGPMKKVGTAAFEFPTGKGSTYAPIAVDASPTSNIYQAEYFNTPYGGTTTLNTGVGAVSQKEYWKLNRMSGSGNPSVTLNWKNSTTSGITTMTGMQVARLDTVAQKWSSNGNKATSGNVPGAGSVSSTAVSNFGVFTIANSSPTALPVTLISFKAAPSGGMVNLTWATSMEINNDRFEIERSKDGKTFEKIGTVNGAGNSKVKREYSYTDRSMQKGVVYYRLRQVDLNGEFEVFPMQVVKMNTAEIKTVAPNPFRDRFEVQYELAANSNVTIEIYKISGEKVYAENVSGNEGINVYRYNNGTNLAAGTYILHLISEGQRITTKIIKS